MIYVNTTTGKLVKVLSRDVRLGLGRLARKAVYFKKVKELLQISELIENRDICTSEDDWYSECLDLKIGVEDKELLFIIRYISEWNEEVWKRILVEDFIGFNPKKRKIYFEDEFGNVDFIKIREVE